MQYPHRGGICRRYAWDLVILDSPKYTASLSPHTCAPVIHQKGILRREQIVDTRATMSSSKFPAALSCLILFLHGNIIVLLLAVSGYTCSHLALTGYDRDTQCCPCRVTQGWLSTFVTLFSLSSPSLLPPQQHGTLPGQICFSWLEKQQAYQSSRRQSS